MKTYLKLMTVILCILLTGCTYAASKQSPEQIKFTYKCSAVPSVDKTKAAQDAADGRKVVKYDDIRAVWLSYIDLAPMLTGKTQQQFAEAFDTACKRISDLGCNTIFVHIRPFGDAVYESDFYPSSKYITGNAGEKGAFDPLDIMIEKAHAYNLSIHGWINPLRLESEDSFSGYDSKYLTKQWYDSNNGYVGSVEGDKHLWLNPGYSEVRKLIADGAAEIARKYDIDGIHYDDYFYPTTDESFDKACFAQNGKDKTLSIWRLENITDMVKGIYDAVKAVNSELVVGVSPQGNLDNNYRYMYADVKKWGSEKGYVDYICPQIYFGYNNPVKPFASTLNEWEKVVTEPHVSLCIGLAVYKIEGTESEFVDTNGIISKQIADIYASKRCKGFSLYAYNNLFSDSERAKNELESIKETLKTVP